MIQPGVRAVVFDVVGTLVEPNPPVAEAYCQVALRHGVDRGVAEIRRRFVEGWRLQESIDAAAAVPFATSRDREMERWRRIVGDVFDQDPRSAAIFEELWDHFGRTEAWRPLEPGRRLMREALDAGVTVALASNFDERLFALARVLEPLTWADHVFASSELGWRKPAPEFFRAIEARLGCGPSQLLLIGDDPELDVAAGLRAGWHVLSLAHAASRGPAGGDDEGRDDREGGGRAERP